MSFNQPRGDSSQYRRTNRSGSFSQKNSNNFSGKGGGGAAAPPASANLQPNRSFSKKSSNAQGGQYRASGYVWQSDLNSVSANPNAPNGSQFQLAPAPNVRVPNPVVKTTTEQPAQTSDQVVPNAPSQVANVKPGPVPQATPTKDTSKSFPIQFGSVSPGTLNGMQIPARTSSSPANLVEQQWDQAPRDVQRQVPPVPIPSVPKQQIPRKDGGAGDQPKAGEGHQTPKASRNIQVPSPVPASQTQKAHAHNIPGVSMPMPFHHHVPVQFGGPNPQMQPQGMAGTSLTMPVHLPMGSAPQLPHSIYLPGLHPHPHSHPHPHPHPHPMQAQGIMHQGQELNFPSQIGQQLCQVATMSSCTKDDVYSSEDRDQGKTEPDDWEDATEISTPKLENTESGSKVSGSHKHVDSDEMAKKCTRGFLMKFSEQCTDLTEGFEITSDVADALMVPNVNVSYESYPSPGRVMDRSPGGPRRGGVAGDEDRWNRIPGPLVPGRDIRMDGHGGNFRPGQGESHGVLRNVRGQPSSQYAGGILSGPMHPMGSHVGVQRGNSDADRWQCANGFQKGLLPSPQTPAPVMHKAERKYQVGKIADDEEAKKRQLKAILNKLTPQNFERIFEQIKGVNIDSAGILPGVISHIYKALMEPTFCEMYANFCFHLARVLPDFNEDNEKITFKRLLLKKCQEEFERGEREEEEAGRDDTESEVKQSPAEREEKRIQTRRRMLGNIRLIGELYKKRMLTERIMHECIKKLLGQYQNPDEENIEALCKLMSTIGEMIDHPKAKEHMDAYFDMMLRLSNNMKLSSRVRFMLKDAIDLRKNKWQQRRKIEGPKKIEAVHRDAAQERQVQASRLARGPGPNSSVRNRQPMDFSFRGPNVLSSPMHPMGSHVGVQRGNSDADRWQRANGFQKGLLPSPQTPAPVMHKAERKYQVGKIADDEEAKKRQLKAILNKLTSQNFERIFEQIKGVNIDSAGILLGVISHIYKALMEPTFCEMYANFCFHLARVLPDFNVDNEKINFRRLLLNKCQEEFERGEREEEEAGRDDTESEVKQSPAEREEKRIQTRRRMLGNIRLLGELYKKRMLTERIMHECIKKLLGQYQNPDEENIEALCKLMSTIGEMIDHPKAKEHMDAYFDMMLRLSNNMKLSSRVRFMLKDAIDLRKNKWQQRRKIEGPKKIEDVHRDAAQERQVQASRLARGPGPNSSVRNRQPMDFSFRGPNVLSSPMHPMGSHVGVQRGNSDADRWQRANGFQKGLLPSPQTPAPVMHKAERKYQVGKIADDEEAKKRQLKAILNKLTSQNFERIFEQIKGVNIDSAGILPGVISHIYKALMEPTFCEMYANFCFHLARVLPDFNEDNEKINFRRLLLNKCQEEFERGEREEEEAGRDDTESEVKQSPAEREEKRIQTRRRMLGNIRLLGELYKKKMLTERIMHECIKKLLGQYQNPDEENIEALCKLMSTIGEMIDHPKAKEHMDAYFDMMLRLSNNMKLSSRVRFMLKDAIDLKKNKWQQRRKIEGPKKIEDVHRDAAQERQVQASRLARGPGPNSSVRNRQRMDFGSRGPNVLSSPNTQMGGYRGLQSQPRGFGVQDARMDDRHYFESRGPSVPLPQRPLGEESITLGPQGGLARGMSSRGQPSFGNTPLSQAPSSVDSRRGPGLNGFGSVPDRSSYVSGDPRFNMPQRFSGPYDQGPILDRSTSFGNRDVRTFDHTGNRSRPISPNVGGLGLIPSQNVPSGKVEERLREMSLSTIKEFYSAKDENEVALCVKEFNSPSFHPTMISLWVSDSFERKDNERDSLAKLLTNLSRSGDSLLNHDHLIKGFESVLSQLEDAVNDAPKAGEFLGRIFAKIVAEDVIPFSEIGQLIYEGGEEQGSLVEVGLAAEVVGTMLEFVKLEKGDSFLNEIRTSSGSKLERFRPPNSKKPLRLDKFI